MNKILNFFEDKIPNCKCYKTYKFCFDTKEYPTSDYNDHKDFKVRKSGETEKHDSYISLEKRMKSEITSLFRFFLDGSRRTYKVDDIAIGNRVFPIIAGQIGVGCCERVDKDTFKPIKLENGLVVSIPECSDKDGSDKYFFNNLLMKLNELSFLKQKNLEFKKILTYRDSKTYENDQYENLAIAKIQDEMIQQEKEVVKSLVREKLINQDSYLLKDGSLEYSEKGVEDKSFRLSLIKSNYQHVVGVSKSFNPELCDDGKTKSMAKKIAELPLYSRTPAFLLEPNIIQDVKFCVWYVRIRDIKRTISPFDGIVKIEKILIKDNEMRNGLESEDVDMISANICNERNPVAYGSDKRWANHLYPVFLTESYIKSKYLSDIYYLNLF